MPCEKIKTQRVICDEIFYLPPHIEENVDVGFNVPEDSTIQGSVEVTLQNCETSIIENIININFLFMIQKELVVVPPQTQPEDGFPLEYAERISLEADFQKCDPQFIEDELEIDIDDLKCQIVFVDGDDTLTLDPQTNTFSEILNINVKAKLVQEVQEIIQICPPNQQTIIEV